MPHTTRSVAPGHRLMSVDLGRIPCQHTAKPGARPCGQPSVWCSHDHWSANGRASVTFNYYCEAHAGLRGMPPSGETTWRPKPLKAWGDETTVRAAKA